MRKHVATVVTLVIGCGAGVAATLAWPWSFAHDAAQVRASGPTTKESDNPERLPVVASLAVSAGSALVLTLVFRTWLGVPFPAGPWGF